MVDLKDSVAPEKALICEKRKEEVFGSAGMM